MNERILITGGAGFLGTALTARLCERFELVLLDNLRRNALQSTGLLDRPGVTLVRADVLDAAAVQQAVQGCTRVVHMASLAGVEVVQSDPVATMRTTLLGSEHVLQACRRAPGIRGVVIMSSSEVYGSDADGVGEADAVLPPDDGEARWSYAVSKLAAERLGLAYQRQYGVPVGVVRPFNVYGPGQVGPGAVHTFVRRLLQGAPLELHNGGGQVRAWCYVDDLTAGMEAALFSPAAVGQVFNLGNPEATLTIRELAQEIKRLGKSSVPLVPVSRTGPEVGVRVPDISRARRLLGFDPRVGLEQGLELTIAWYRAREAGRLEVAGA